MSNLHIEDLVKAQGKQQPDALKLAKIATEKARADKLKAQAEAIRQKAQQPQPQPQSLDRSDRLFIWGVAFVALVALAQFVAAVALLI